MLSTDWVFGLLRLLRFFSSVLVPYNLFVCLFFTFFRNRLETCFVTRLWTGLRRGFPRLSLPASLPPEVGVKGEAVDPGTGFSVWKPTSSGGSGGGTGGP